MQFPDKSIIEQFYQAGLWTQEMVENAMSLGFLTAEEYEEIIGKETEY